MLTDACALCCDCRCGKNMLAWVLCNAWKTKKPKYPITDLIKLAAHFLYEQDATRFDSGTCSSSIGVIPWYSLASTVALVVWTSHLMHAVLLTSARSKQVLDPPDARQLLSVCKVWSVKTAMMATWARLRVRGVFLGEVFFPPRDFPWSDVAPLASQPQLLN